MSLKAAPLQRLEAEQRGGSLGGTTNPELLPLLLRPPMRTGILLLHYVYIMQVGVWG